MKIAENSMENFFQKEINRDASTDVFSAKEQEQASTVISLSLSSLTTSHGTTTSSPSVCISPTTNSVPE